MLRSVSELCIARGGGQTRDCSNPPRFPPSAPHVPHPPAHGRPAATAAAVQPHTSASPAALGYCVAVQSAGGRWPTLFFSLVKPPLAPCGHTLRMLEGVPARGGSTSRPTLFPPPTPHPPFPLPPLPHRRYQLASFVAGALRAPLPAGWLCRRSTLALFLNGPPLIPPPPPYADARRQRGGYTVASPFLRATIHPLRSPPPPLPTRGTVKFPRRGTATTPISPATCIAPLSVGFFWTRPPPLCLPSLTTPLILCTPLSPLFPSLPLETTREDPPLTLRRGGHDDGRRPLRRWPR